MNSPHHRTHVGRRSLLTIAASVAGLFALAGCATAASAHRNLASIEVFDRDSGQVVPSYTHGGRQFVPGRPGARYALRLRNLTHARVLVVLSVDGVNVISGETADWQQVGYVLDPGRSFDINGWRKSGTEIAAFEFAPVDRSYAALTGRPGDVGVIGMAVFRERALPPPPAAPPLASRAEKRAAEPGALGSAPAESRQRSALADAASPKLGTGHGQREWSVSRRTHFERATTAPEQLAQLEYDSHERLVAAGVIPMPSAYVRPRAFPGSQPGFVPDPPLR